MRVYNRWAGNPRGRPEDPTRCIASVYPNSRSPVSCQCSKKRGKGPDGLYCGTHARVIERGGYVWTGHEVDEGGA